MDQTNRPARCAVSEDLDLLLRPACRALVYRAGVLGGPGVREPLDVSLVVPRLVAEVAADVALDAAGRWRHSLRLQRIRADMEPADVPHFGTGNDPSSA